MDLIHPPVLFLSQTHLQLNNLKTYCSSAQAQLKGNEEEKKLDKFCLATEPLFHDTKALIVCKIQMTNVRILCRRDRGTEAWLAL